MTGMDTAQLIALAGALGWASGVRLYLVVLLTGLAGFMGWIALPPGLHLLAHPVVLGASGFMVFVEFFADKIPGLDSLWDVVHAVIRIRHAGGHQPRRQGHYPRRHQHVARTFYQRGGVVGRGQHGAGWPVAGHCPPPGVRGCAGAGVGLQRLADPQVLALFATAVCTRRPHFQRQA